MSARAALLAALVGAAFSLAPAAPAAPTPTRWCGGDHAAADRPDAVPGFQIHVVYAYPSDGADRFGERVLPIASDLAAIDGWWRAQDGARAPRFDLAAFPGCDTAFGQLDLSDVRLPHDSSYYTGVGDRYARIRDDLNQPPLSFSDPDKKYLVYYDGPVDDRGVCGTASDGPPEGGPLGFAEVFLGSLCGDGLGGASNTAVTAAHELIHNLGALPQPVDGQGPPHACPGDSGHPCDNPSDILYPRGTYGTTLITEQLDVGRDDYYGHSGPWFDVRNSVFLARLDSPDQSPPVGPASLSATSDGTTVTLSWTAATDDSGPTTYRVYRDGGLLTSTDGLTATDSADPGSTVAYGVRAGDGVGLLGPRLTIRFTVGLGIVDDAGQLVLDTVPPPPVLGLRAAITKRFVLFRWGAVSDPGGLRGYQLERNGKPFAAILPGSSLKVPLRQAKGVWDVRAVDRAGNVGPVSAGLSIR